ncbi:MAG: Gfo/Idh/MocA family oxidoreductase [Lachnospiraceae bacterium]|nr:Gfo/Idh/MocA family oxidoreductase [Lachnospiraceae bacterium]
MKYGLIGCGRIAANHIKAAIDNKLEIVAVCDIILQNAQSLLKRNGFESNKNIDCYDDYIKMISEHPELDIIAIATPSGSHAEIAVYCIEHVINVIIEKPMAMNMSDAEQIIQLSEEKGVAVCACHQNRFNIAVQKTRKALEAGRFGRLSHGSIHVRWNRDKSYYNQSTWRGTWAEDGGCLMNQCIHGIDLLRWMMGDEVDSVYGIMRQQYHYYLETEDVGVATVTFKNGAIGTIEGSTNVYPRNLEETLYLFGENGTVKIGGKSTNNLEVWDFADETTDDQGNRGLSEYISNIYGNGHASIYADVINSIQNKRKPYVDAVAGRNALELVLGIYQSMKTGQPVKFPLKEFSSVDMIGIFEKNNALDIVFK